MLELIASAGRSIVEASWHAAAVFTKFYLAYTVFRLWNSDSLGRDTFEDLLLEESQKVVGIFFLLGTFNFSLGLDLGPGVTAVGEFVALVYLGFLFWRF